MKPQELRIGNLVRIRATKQIAEVTAINKLGVEVNDNFLAPLRFSEIEPVPLAEEWLLNYGFEKSPRQYWLKPNSGFFFGVSTELGVLYLFDDEMPIPTECKHVHELQNLYYALTNEELTQKN